MSGYVSRERRALTLRPELIGHFWERVEKGEPDACWPWTGTMQNQRYGTLGRWVEGRKEHYLAHRLAYEINVGPLRESMVIDHLCRNRRCANPGHLEQVTNTLNIIRGEWAPVLNRQKVTCPRGHAYDYVNPTNGHRGCRTCTRDQQRAARVRKAS